jgi:preprotein translocase subunit SecA
MKITELYNEIEDIKMMDLEKVQNLYNVDTKEEIIALIEEEIESCEQIGCSGCNEWNEHGFNDSVDFWKFVA